MRLADQAARNLMQSVVNAGIMTHERASRVPIHVAGTSGRRTFGVAYARPGVDCELYLYQSGNRIICHECKLTDYTSSPMFDERGKVIDHVLQHSLKQHKMPDGIIMKLIEEIK